MKRVTTKLGDIFSVDVDEDNRKYFQLIAFDLTQLNSDVIRSFRRSYGKSETPDIKDIISGEVEFYAHCVTSLGIKLGLWQFVGRDQNVGITSNIIFRDTSDYGVKKGDEPVKISNNWYVWNINDSNFKHVGKLEGENRKSEIGVVINPFDIVERIKSGKYNFVYPGFE